MHFFIIYLFIQFICIGALFIIFSCLILAVPVYWQADQWDEGGGEPGGHSADGADERRGGSDGELRGPHGRRADREFLHAQGRNASPTWTLPVHTQSIKVLLKSDFSNIPRWWFMRGHYSQEFFFLFQCLHCISKIPTVIQQRSPAFISPVAYILSSNITSEKNFDVMVRLEKTTENSARRFLSSLIYKPIIV